MLVEELTDLYIKFRLEQAAGVVCKVIYPIPVSSFKDKIHLVPVSHIYKDNFFIFQPIKKQKIIQH